LKFITAIWYVLSPFENLVAIWYFFLRFGLLNEEKSGNPAPKNDLCASLAINEANIRIHVKGNQISLF
jgi:hypothetical protein